MSGEEKVPSVKERIQQQASGAHKTPEELKAETAQCIAKEVFSSESPFTKERQINADLERDRMKAQQDGKLKLVNMSGGHLASLIFWVWMMLSVTGATAAAAMYLVMAQHAEPGAVVPVQTPAPIVINTRTPSDQPHKPPQLFVFLPQEGGLTKTIRVEGINPATWPDEVRIRLSDMEALKAILQELKPPDPPKAAPPEKKAARAANTQVKKAKDGSTWLPPPRDVVPQR